MSQVVCRIAFTHGATENHRTIPYLRQSKARNQNGWTRGLDQTQENGGGDKDLEVARTNLFLLDFNWIVLKGRAWHAKHFSSVMVRSRSIARLGDLDCSVENAGKD